MVRIKVRVTIGEVTIEEGTARGTTTYETTMAEEERFEAITTGEKKTVEEMNAEITTREKTAEERESHRITGRQHISLQAKELQMSYRRGAKKCMEKILGEAEERRQCGISPAKMWLAGD